MGSFAPSVENFWTKLEKVTFSDYFLMDLLLERALDLTTKAFDPTVFGISNCEGREYRLSIHKLLSAHGGAAD